MQEVKLMLNQDNTRYDLLTHAESSWAIFLAISAILYIALLYFDQMDLWVTSIYLVFSFVSIASTKMTSGLNITASYFIAMIVVVFVVWLSEWLSRETAYIYVLLNTAPPIFLAAGIFGVISKNRKRKKN